MVELPLIASFVVRFFRDAADAEAVPRVMVRHVQTGQEFRFRKPAEAMAFMEEFLQQQPMSPSTTEE